MIHMKHLKKFVDELDSYNGIQYLETYIAE